MFQKMVWLLKALWLDQRGEEPGDTSSETETSDTTVKDTVDETVITEETIEPDPIVAEFGEIPQDPQQFAEYVKNNIYSKYSKSKTDFDNFRNKASLTERNLATLRQTLEGSGIRAVQDADGTLRLETIKPAARQSRFNEEALRKFAVHFENNTDGAKSFLNPLQLFIQDQIEEMLEGERKTWQENTARQRAWSGAESESVELMFAYFPQLNGKDGQFDKAFHDKVYEAWEANPALKRDPRGQLLTALRVARELNILPQAIKAAETKGFEKGKETKKILGPVKPKSAGNLASKAVWSKEDYLNASEEERAEYDKKQLDKTKGR